MPKKEYGWQGGNVPIIGEHSLAKHRILRAYVQRYIEVLTKNPRVDRMKLALIDGFAGGGIYQHNGLPHFGSPAILIEATAAAQDAVNLIRVKPVAIEPAYFFIDNNPSNLSALQDTLRNHVYPRHPNVAPTFLNGAFEDKLGDVVASIKRIGRAHRAIFVLDQYGYNAVPLSSLQLIFRELPNAEVFLTLAVGWIAAYLRHSDGAREVIQKSLGFRTAATDEELEDQLLGGTGSAVKLRVVQKLLHDAFVQRSGARYATPFFIVSRGSHRPYWFLHVANSIKANDVVKDLHWEVQNHFSHYGDAGLSMLGFDPYKEPDPAQLGFAFDSVAKARTGEALLRQLPDRIGKHPAGVSFEELFSAVTNETPASMEMVRSALTTLCCEGELIKHGAGGEHRRVETAVRNDDVILLPRQIRMNW